MALSKDQINHIGIILGILASIVGIISFFLGFFGQKPAEIPKYDKKIISIADTKSFKEFIKINKDKIVYIDFHIDSNSELCLFWGLNRIAKHGDFFLFANDNKYGNFDCTNKKFYETARAYTEARYSMDQNSPKFSETVDKIQETFLKANKIQEDNLFFDDGDDMISVCADTYSILGKSEDYYYGWEEGRYDCNLKGYFIVSKIDDERGLAFSADLKAISPEVAITKFK